MVGFLRNATHLIQDRDPLFTKAGRVSADCSTSTATRPRDLLPWVLGHYGFLKQRPSWPPHKAVGSGQVASIVGFGQVSNRPDDRG